MFEDDPPPLPSAPSIETSCDNIFTDLSDQNRFTAVADDDYDGDDAGFSSHMSAVFQTLTESDSEFVNSELGVPQSESIKAFEIPDRAQNFFTKTLPRNDSDGRQNLSSSLQSRSPQFAQISKPQSSSPEISGCLENLDVITSSITAHSIQVITSEDETTIDESHGVPAFVKERKDSTESRKDEANESSDLQNIDSFDENEKGKVVQSALENDKDDDEDEFGDFEKFTKAEKTQKSENDNWADFESSSFPDFDMENKSTGAVASSGAELQFTAETPQLPALLENLCDNQLWTAATGEEENNGEHDVPDNGVYETLSDAINSKHNDRPDEMVWIAVSIIEEAPALKLQWHDSSIRSFFLNSLDVDVNQTVIRNSDLPVFAQQLEESAVLAPVSLVESCVGATLIDEKNSFPQSNSADYLSHVGMERSSVSQLASSRSVTIDSLAVPPVQFDWNNSGLTNPLKTGSLSVSSASLDLDFLVSTNSKGSAGDGSPTMQVFSTLQKDLTALGLNLSDDAGKSKTEKDISSNAPIVLDYILNKNDDKQKYKPVSELSLDARALHDQLPDLDYMLSNVLLFPVVDR
uniref:Clathrin_bdg domain-containing protein n=1 Tax=Elaeophora elaphi TaxID=1147741 RepID=A0A0R3RYN3_9BILA